MKIGISGHQNRAEIDWAWVHNALYVDIRQLQRPTEALTSLAAGSDQVFAAVATSLDIPLTAVIPLDGYERFFSGVALSQYRAFLKASQVVRLPGGKNDEESFLKAGQFIVDNCDLLYAIWDGLSSRGKGGTGDIVEYAISKGTEVRWIDPIARTLNRKTLTF